MVQPFVRCQNLPSLLFSTRNSNCSLEQLMNLYSKGVYTNDTLYLLWREFVRCIRLKVTLRPFRWKRNLQLSSLVRNLVLLGTVREGYRPSVILVYIRTSQHSTRAVKTLWVDILSTKPSRLARKEDLTISSALC